MICGCQKTLAQPAAGKHLKNKFALEWSVQNVVTWSRITEYRKKQQKWRKKLKTLAKDTYLFGILEIPTSD